MTDQSVFPTLADFSTGSPTANGLFCRLVASLYLSTLLRMGTLPLAVFHRLLMIIDSFGRGEAVVVIVIKLLEDAIRDGDKIYATVSAHCTFYRAQYTHILWLTQVLNTAVNSTGSSL
jgi:hypothetical protein